MPLLPFPGKFRVGILIVGKHGFPLLPGLFAAAQAFFSVGIDLGSYIKGLTLDVEGCFSASQFFLSQGLAMSTGLALFSLAAKANEGGTDNQGWRRGVLRLAQGFKHLAVIVAIINANNLPAIGPKARAHILAEGQVSVALNADPVVVIEHCQFAQLKGTGQRSRFTGDAFHHAAIARQYKGVMIHQWEIRLVEPGRQHALSNGESHSIGKALAKGSRGGFHALRQPMLGMPRRNGPPLPKQLYLLNRHLVSSQMQQRVDERAGVPVGKDEPIPVSPGGRIRVMLHGTQPQRIGHWSHAHRRTRMPAVGFLYHFGRKDTQRINSLFLNVHLYTSPHQYYHSFECGWSDPCPVPCILSHSAKTAQCS